MDWSVLRDIMFAAEVEKEFRFFLLLWSKVPEPTSLSQMCPLLFWGPCSFVKFWSLPRPISYAFCLMIWKTFEDFPNDLVHDNTVLYVVSILLTKHDNITIPPNLVKKYGHPVGIKEREFSLDNQSRYCHTVRKCADGAEAPVLLLLCCANSLSVDAKTLLFADTSDLKVLY